MRTVTTLFELEDIILLYQYLYMSKEHYIIVNNGMTDLKIYMDDNLNFHCINMTFPNVPPLSYNDNMNILGCFNVIEHLKTQPPKMQGAKFTDAWDEIKNITRMQLGANLDNYKNLKQRNKMIGEANG